MLPSHVEVFPLDSSISAHEHQLFAHRSDLKFEKKKEKKTFSAKKISQSKEKDY